MLLDKISAATEKRLENEASYLALPYDRASDEMLMSRVISLRKDTHISILEAVENDTICKYAIYIPKAYARGEVNDYPRLQDLESGSIARYELYITDQVGSPQCRRNTYIYLKLPSGRMAAIVLYTDRGVGFEPRDHKFVLRELDELDRRIVLGFCRLYQYSLRDACHGYSNWNRTWLKDQARSYNASKQPKRFKQGREGRDMRQYYGSVAPYDESSIFDNLKMK